MLWWHWQGPGPERAGGATLASAGLWRGCAAHCGPALPAGFSSCWEGSSRRGPKRVSGSVGAPQCLPPSQAHVNGPTAPTSRVFTEGKEKGGMQIWWSTILGRA